MASKLRIRPRRPGAGTGRPAAREAVAAQIERLTLLDRVAAPLQSAVRKVVPTGTAAKDALSGTWLGHPLHPALTDLVIGFWWSAFLLDVAGGRRRRDAAELLVGAGILSALPTAASGASDWAELRGGPRRVGLVHALGNTTTLTLQALSWRARRRGDHGAGIALSSVAMGTATFSAWLGGHLSFGRGVGVNQTAFDEFPESWTRVADEDELEQGELVRVDVDGAGVLLVRNGAWLHALADRCSHRGCSLSEGMLRDETIVCACHGSTFALDGSLLRGPATAPQPALEVRVREGGVEICRPQGA